MENYRQVLPNLYRSAAPDSDDILDDLEPVNAVVDMRSRGGNVVPFLFVVTRAAGASLACAEIEHSCILRHYCARKKRFLSTASADFHQHENCHCRFEVAVGDAPQHAPLTRAPGHDKGGDFSRTTLGEHSDHFGGLVQREAGHAHPGALLHQPAWL